MVHGWSEEALIGMFMGGLTMEIAEAVRMFKPQSLKDVISLAHMKDDQIHKMRKSHPWTPNTWANGVTQERSSNATIKRLIWDEMQRRRAHGLCFNCKEQFTLGHRCRQPQVLLLKVNEEE